MSLASEFKEFALRGNVVDLAVGIVIGAAFGKIVSSFVADVLMPPLGMMLGGVNFTDLAITMKEATASTPAVLWSYGKFVQSILDFTIIAFAIFLLIKAMNTMKKKEEAKPAPAQPPQEVLLTEIRDLLKRR
jgi:large conductance mechanosensitive channel